MGNTLPMIGVFQLTPCNSSSTYCYGWLTGVNAMSTMTSAKDLESEERQALQRLYNALEEVRVIAQHMPVQQVMALILVALHEGKSLKELATLMDCKMPTLSRQMIDLGPRNRRMEPGYQLVESRQDPMEYRKNQYTLTVRGKHIIKAMLKAIGGR